MAKPAKRNIDIPRRSDYEHQLVFPDDVSANTYRSQIREDFDAAPAIEFEVDMTDAATGIVVLHLTTAQTDPTFDQGVWDVWQTDPAVADPLFGGHVRFLPTVTHDD